MNIDTTFLRCCIDDLEEVSNKISEYSEADNFPYDIYCELCVKKFEVVLEQSGKLLRKHLATYFASNRQADRLSFRDLFRHAAQHDLIDVEAVERWLRYRDTRNDTAHDYGEEIPETLLALLPSFIVDARALADIPKQTKYAHKQTVANRLHLSEKHQHILETLLREHLPSVEVWAYGSRVNGRSHDGSDLDLILRGPELQEIPIDQLVDFEEALQKSKIPFLVEARDWARVPERFHQEIERQYVVLVSSAQRAPVNSLGDSSDHQ